MQYRENTLLELYTDSEDSFNVGTICLQNDTEILFKSIDEQGKEAGYYVISKDSVQKVLYDTVYLKKIGLYMEWWQEHTYKEWVTFEKDMFRKEDSIFMQALRYAQDAGLIVTIDGFIEEIYTGYVEEVSHEIVKIECLDISSACAMEGAQVDLKSIQFLEFESIDNHLLQYAAENM